MKGKARLTTEARLQQATAYRNNPRLTAYRPEGPTASIYSRVLEISSIFSNC